MENRTLKSSELSVIAADVSIEGTLFVKRELHFFGKLTGELVGSEQSLILIKEGAVIEGKITANEIIIDGFVNGEIHGKSKVWVTQKARVIGNVQSPSLQVDPGAIFEARVKM